MDAAQKSALERVAGRALSAAEIGAIDLLLPVRNDVEIAALLSAGRTRLVPHEVGERGILDAAGPIDGEALVSVLESIRASTDLPAALQPYLGAIRRAVEWLKKDGLDVGSKTTRDLLDALSAAGKIDAASVAAVKRLAERPDPIHYNTVSDALNVAERRLTLG